ncbi:MAG: amidophosphoribosyltransferase, partial [Flavobacteriales bacterium]
TLVNIGQHPKEHSDTVTILERIGHYLDQENERLFRSYKEQGYSKKEISGLIADNMDIGNILKNSAEDWDGGYTMGGIMGHGDAFVLRDPNGIRPAYYYENEEMTVVCSEKPVIRTVFNAPPDEVKEVSPGHALIMKKQKDAQLEQITNDKERRSCSFERIYFSRGSDFDIYKERKELGRSLCSSILDAIDEDLENTVFSFIPNTAEVAFYGLKEGLNDHLDEKKKNAILDQKENLTSEELENILREKPRIEKVAIKDAKLRTFITNDNARDDLVAHVYDITYGTVKTGKDNLVVLDDSIVRGTTLKESILRILDRLSPKKIVVASSAPQIRFPDCYGIDMAKLGDLIAFQAAIHLISENKKNDLIDEVYKEAKSQIQMPKEENENVVKKIFKPFEASEISNKISELLTPPDANAKVRIIYQSIEGLHKACPYNKGDWYFTGNYPTPGGNKFANRAFVNFCEGRDERAY